MAATTYTNPDGPLCGPAAFNLSDAAKSKLSKVPAPLADQLCPTLLNGPVNTCKPHALLLHGTPHSQPLHGATAAQPLHLPLRCAGNLGALIESFLIGVTGPPACNPAGQVDPSQFGQPVPFRDRCPLPAGAFPDVGATFREEGATYYW